jgi:hypothetical protein
MPVESVTHISDLNASNPLGTDPGSDVDNHIRNLKTGIKTTFPNISGAVTPTHTELNYVDGVTSAIQGQIDAKAATSAFANSIGASGYQKLHGGLILQWGSGTSSGTSAGNGSVTYPLAFPNATLQAYAVVGGSSSGDYTIQTTSSDATGAVFTVQQSAAGATGVGFGYLAIGY